MNQYGEGNADKPKNPSGLHPFFKHKITVDNTIYRVQNQEKRAPSDRRLEIEINEKMPGPMRHPDMDEEEERSQDEQTRSQDDANLTKRFVLVKTKSIGECR